MPVTVRKAGVFKPTVWPWVNVNGYWYGAKKVWSKRAGTWEEGLAEESLSASLGGDLVRLRRSGWKDRHLHRLDSARRWPSLRPLHRPARVRRPDDGCSLPAGRGRLRHRGTRCHVHQRSHRLSAPRREEGLRAGLTGKNPTVITTSAGAGRPSRLRPRSYQMNLPIPAVPTSGQRQHPELLADHIVDASRAPRLAYFQVQIWLWGYAASTYNIGAGERSWAGQPWDPGTVGRHGVSIQVSAVGSGGQSAWVYTDGVMPGPMVLSSCHYNSGTLYVLGQQLRRLQPVARRTGAVPRWEYQGAYGRQQRRATGSPTRRRPATPGQLDAATSRLPPRNAANGWTGRTQGSGYAIKIPNPVYFEPNDTNTWWTIPIPGKWRTNPQADNWFYQGKSISGNSYGTLFYGRRSTTTSTPAGSVTTSAITSWGVYIKRTYTGGLVAAVASEHVAHNRRRRRPQCAALD